MQKLFAEFIGTAILVLLGCGSVAIGGYLGQGASGILTIGLAFGLTYASLIYAFGATSGGHFNPAVSLAMLFAGRMSFGDFARYIIVQLCGGICGAFVLAYILLGKGDGYNLAASGLGQNASNGYSFGAVALVEIIATFIFTTVILSVTREKATSHIAGLVIGLTLALLIVVFFNVTGVSVNPARSIGPALIVGGNALIEMWMFIAFPLVGAALAGLLSKVKTFG